MTRRYTAASFTKHFSWQRSFKRLHSAIGNGFSAGLQPVTRDDWRERSQIKDHYRELIPMNFFLYSKRGLRDDFILVDTLVELAATRAYDEQFARLSLFAFHLANSGNWHKSQWPDGRVAGWANLLIRSMVWQNGEWAPGGFQETTISAFLDHHLEGERGTKRKVFTNYRHMLRNAGVLVDDVVQPLDMRAPWILNALQLFWDRQIFDGSLLSTANLKPLEDLFFRHEIHKLLGCSEDQGRAFVVAAFRDYARERMAGRFDQLRRLRDKLDAAA